MSLVVLVPGLALLLLAGLWVVYKFSVYALPSLAGYLVAKWAYDTGSGAVVAVIVFLIAGVVVHFGGQLLYMKLWWPPVRFALAAIYCIPAGMAGYAVSLILLSFMAGAAPTGLWREVFVWTWVSFTALTALVRLAQVAFFIGDPDRELKGG